MKKVITIGFLLICISNQLFSQKSIFYDAIFIRDSCYSVPDKVLNNRNSLITLLGKYYPDISASNIEDRLKSNPFFKELTPDHIAMINLVSTYTGFQFSNLGGINVTNFADGLAKFLVERSKEELNVAFFSEFQKYLQKYPEVQIVFPTTYEFLNQIYSYQYTAMLPALKAAFQKDLNAFSTNLLKLRDISNYNVDGERKERAIKITNFLKTQEGRSLIGAIIVSNGIVKGNNAAEIISNLASDEICTNYSDENFPNLIQLVDLISQSLRSNEDGRVWITKQQATDLVKDELTFKIYLGLVYAVDQKNKHQISFKTGGNAYSIETFLRTLGENWNSSETAKFKESFASLANSMVEVADNAKNILNAKGQGDQASILVYADYASSIASLFQQSVNFLSYNPTLNKYAPEMLRFATVIEDATNACYDLKSQNYTALVLHTSSILSSVLGPEYTHKDNFLKYGVFMANVVEAKSSDEVQAAIEASVLPVGSSSIKRETDMNISLNAFIGPFAGAEYMPTLNETEEQWAFSTGLTAPVGVAFSWGNIGKGKENCKGNVSGGKSFTLFLPVIDVGALASFRMGDDSTNVASEVTLSNIVSPGLFFYYGFGKCPVSIGLGGQFGPQLRGVTAIDIDIDKNYYLRFGFNIVVDIPLFNLYTKN